MSKDTTTVDDLSYAWPQNILKYETKFWGGLTMGNLMAGALPLLAALFFLSKHGHTILGFVLGGLAGGLGVLVTKPFEGLGGVSLPKYLWMRFVGGRQNPIIEMPLIMPMEEQGSYIVESLDGEVIMEVGGD